MLPPLSFLRVVPFGAICQDQITKTARERGYHLSLAVGTVKTRTSISALARDFAFL